MSPKFFQEIFKSHGKHQQQQQLESKVETKINIGMYTHCNTQVYFQALRDADMGSFSKLKAQILELLKVSPKLKIVFLLSNLNHLAENIIIDSEDDLRLLKSHSANFDHTFNLQGLIFESATEIEDGCGLYEFQSHYKRDSSAMPIVQVDFLKDFSLLPSAMLINYSKFIQLLTLKEDTLTLDMNVFQDLSSKVKRLVQNTGQGKQFMTQAQLSKYQLYWSSSSQIAKSQIEVNKKQPNTLSQSSVESSSKQDAKSNIDATLAQKSEVVIEKEINGKVIEVKNLDSGKRQIEEVKENVQDLSMESIEEEEYYDDGLEYDPRREESEQELNDAFEMVDFYMTGADQTISEQVTPQLTDYISEELYIKNQIDAKEQILQASDKMKCGKCSVLLKSDKDIFYTCQQCKTLYLCESCEDIYSHSHPFLKLRPDPVLLNLDQLCMKYKQIEALEQSLSESIYDCNQIIKRVFILKNSGTLSWPEETKIYLIDNPFGVVTNTPIKMGAVINPSEQRKVTIKLRTPQDMGKYRLIFRLGVQTKSDRLNLIQSQINGDQTTTVHHFGKPLVLEFEVLESSIKSQHLNNDLLMSEEGALLKSQIINEDYMKLELQKQEYKEQLRGMAKSQVQRAQPLTKERKKAHKFLMKLGFYDFESNEQLLKNCKDNLQVVTQILIQQQMKALNMTI